MGQITSSVGLISGINTGAIIDELISLDQQPVTLLQTRMQAANAQQQAYSTLETALNSIQSFGQSFSLASTWGAATTTSSDQNVLTATAANGASVGTYQFQVARTVSTQQSVSQQGFSDFTTTKMQAGTITLSQGPAGVTAQTTLSVLNGGNGVAPGTFRITDSNGKSDTINTAGDITLDDVVNQINTALDISVRASVGPKGLQLADTAGGPGSISVVDLGNGATAQGLGLTAATATATTSTNITGGNINYLSRSFTLASLKDGRGVSTVNNGKPDFTITAGDGSSFAITIDPTQTTVGNVIDAINTATGGKVVASIAPGGDGITLNDASGGGGNLTVTADNGSLAAQDLGIVGSASGTITGAPVIAGLDSVLLSSLNGGAGLTLGTISITDRGGNTNANIDLSGDHTLQDVLDTINNNGTAKVTASINQAGDGIQIIDNSGGSGNLVVADVGGLSSATQLGIAGTFNNTVTADVGGALHKQWLSASSQLADINGGKGISPGAFSITNAAGVKSTITISTGNQVTVGDIINDINSQQGGITASINTTGDGILLTDTSGGAGKLTVANVTGSTATDLNLVGTATGTTIDGAYTKTITVTNNDTLQTVQQKINNLNFGVSAGIINDGSGAAPYRLQLSAQNPGLDGQVVIDAGTTGLQTQDLVKAQNAAVFLGDPNTGKPLLFTSSSNQLTDAIPGVTINLLSASKSPVTLTVSQDTSSIKTQLSNFVQVFNGLVQSIGALTTFNTTTNQGSLLLGDATIREIQSTLYEALNSRVQGAGQYTSLADLGITVGKGATLSLNSSTFDAVFAKDPNAVQSLFTQTKTGLGTVISNEINKLTDPVNGIITVENQSISTQVQSFNTQITNLNKLLADKKNRLEEQFANMESVLSGLQSQQSALTSLASLSTLNTSASSSSSKSSTSSASG